MVGPAPKVVITEHSFTTLAREIDAVKQAGGVFVEHQCKNSEDAVAVLNGAFVALVQLVKITEQAVAGMQPGGVIIRYGVGVDNIPLVACAKHNIRICNVPDYGAATVADHAMAMLLSLLLRLPQLDKQVRSGAWDARVIRSEVASLANVTLGLYGIGRIGQAVLRRAAGFGMRCIAVDPLVKASDLPDCQVELVTEQQLLQQADAISLHLPLTDETRGKLNVEFFAKLKPNAVIVNCSRGGLINEDDLASALKAGTLAGAGIDTVQVEPLPSDSPLRQAPNLILSPHSAWCSLQSEQQLQQSVADEIFRALRGEKLRCQLTVLD